MKVSQCLNCSAAQQVEKLLSSCFELYKKEKRKYLRTKNNVNEQLSLT